MNYVTFDIETYSPSDLNRIDTNEFRVSVIGAYISWLPAGQNYLAFFEDDVKDFLEILKNCDLVVGYNHLWFDLPVLQKYSNFNLLQLPCYDIMLEVEKQIGYKSKLDDLCKANFEQDKKTDSYDVYKNYHKEGKWLELIDYCMNDVRLTQQLFTKILNNKTINYYDLHILKQANLPQPSPNKVNLVEMAESIF
jgi:DNA polymerase III epsilon subunit-like protein